MINSDNDTNGEYLPKVSVIIPVYNVEQYLRQCLDSVVNQTLSDIEIICVNDCSPDNSLSVLKEYADIDNRIKIIDLKENVGLGQARNIAMEQATGEYIMFVDSDDWLELDACEKAYDRINTNKSNICFFTYNFYDESLDEICCHESKLKLYEKYADNNGLVNLKKISIPYILSAEVWYKIYNRQFLEKNNLKMMSNRYFEDVLFSSKAMMCTDNISIVNQPLYNYRKNNKSSITNNAKLYRYYMYAREKTFNEILANCHNDRFFNSYCVENIRSWFYWYNKFTKIEKNIKEEFYQHMRNMIIKTNKTADMNYVKKYIDFQKFNVILHCKNYYIYEIFEKFLFKIFHIENFIDKTKYTIFPIKLTLKKKETSKMKIFERKKDKNRRIFYLCGIKIFSYRKKKSIKDEKNKKSDFEILEYINNKYNQILNMSVIDKKEESSNYIWQYWAQGEENAPDIVKNCLKSVRTYCKDKNVIVLNDDNVENYIDIPDFIQEKRKKNIISRTHFSDYLRTCLLAKYGGTWIDATVLLTDKIPDDIMQSDFFVFKPLSWSECKKVPSIKMLKLLQRIPTYLSRFLCLSSWFIHSKSNNRLMIMTKILLEKYWANENNLIDYYLYHYFVTFLVLYDKKCTEIFNSMPNIANRNPHLLQNVLLDEYDEELFNELKGLSSIHKLTFKIKNRSKKYTFFDEIAKQVK